MPEILGAISEKQGHLAFASESFFELRKNRLITEIPLEEVDTGNMRHFKQVERDYPPPHPVSDHLRPTAGRRTEIYDDLAGSDQFVPVVDFHQLEGRNASRHPAAFAFWTV